MASSTTMALARAFTKRTKRNHQDATPTRESSVRFPHGAIKRDQISLPTELLSTTNVHALTAPDIRSISSSSSNSSIHSNQDSVFSHISRTFLSTPMSSPETSSIESSPVTPELGHHEDYFIPKRSATTAGTRPASGSALFDAPVVPQRAASHSKKAHQELSRKRSQSRLTPPPVALASTTILRHSADFFSGAGDGNHPFGNELAQVNEVAEEFGATSALLEEEEQVLLSKGLAKFGVDDYLDEISGLYGGVFEDELGAMATPWI